MAAPVNQRGPRPRVCHVTSVHVPEDGRILYHECSTLARRFEVVLVCRDDRGPRTIEGVRIVPASTREGGRLRRWASLRTLIDAAEQTRADLYHFHDPELMAAMIGLGRRTGRPVIYDVHEHYPDAVTQRAWIPRVVRPLLAAVADWDERRRAPRFAGLVVADDALRDRFAGLNPRVVAVRNYPPLRLFPSAPRARADDRPPTIAYVGSISVVRGINEVLAVHRSVRERFDRCRLMLVGKPTEDAAEIVAEAVAGDPDHVSFVGPVPYAGLGELLAGVDVGLALLRPHPKYEKNVPTKVFDYMAAGVPYVASDFTPLRAVSGDIGGRLVPPGDGPAAVDAVADLLADRHAARSLGAEGRQLVEDRINWEKEGEALCDLYDSLLTGR